MLRVCFHQAAHTSFWPGLSLHVLCIVHWASCSFQVYLGCHIARKPAGYLTLVSAGWLTVSGTPSPGQAALHDSCTTASRYIQQTRPCCRLRCRICYCVVLAPRLWQSAVRTSVKDTVGAPATAA